MFLYILVCKFQFVHLKCLFLVILHSRKSFCKIQMLRILSFSFPFELVFMLDLKSGVLVTCIFGISLGKFYRITGYPDFLKPSISDN